MMQARPAGRIARLLAALFLATGCGVEVSAEREGLTEEQQGALLAACDSSSLNEAYADLRQVRWDSPPPRVLPPYSGEGEGLPRIESRSPGGPTTPEHREQIAAARQAVLEEWEHRSEVVAPLALVDDRWEGLAEGMVLGYQQFLQSNISVNTDYSAVVPPETFAQIEMPCIQVRSIYGGIE